MRRTGRSRPSRSRPPPPSGSAETISSLKSGKSDVQSPAAPPPRGGRSKQNRLRRVTSHDNQIKISGKEGKRKRFRGSKENDRERERTRTSRELTRESAEKTTTEDPYDKVKGLDLESKFEAKYKKDYEDLKKEKKEEKKELRQSQIGSVFEPISGPAIPAISGVHGVKNKMKWKIDVEPVELRGDQRMPEILEKLKELRKSSGMKPCKVLKANEQIMSSSDDEPTEEVIHMSARILQLVKMEPLISKEISKEDQEILKGFCRCGDQKEKAETIFETITCSILEKVASKNEFIRHVSIPGQVRLFAVDEKKSKLPTMALLIVRKDLFYHAWTKQSNQQDDDEQLDQTWSSMTLKCYAVHTQSAQLPPQPALIKSAHFQPYY